MMGPVAQSFLLGVLWVAVFFIIVNEPRLAPVLVLLAVIFTVVTMDEVIRCQIVLGLIKI